MSRVKIKKGWFNEIEPKETRVVNLFKQVEVTSLADFPKLLSAKEASTALHCSPKTAAALMKGQIIQSMKLRGRRFTTPEWVAEYMKKELLAHG